MCIRDRLRHGLAIAPHSPLDGILYRHGGGGSTAGSGLSLIHILIRHFDRQTLYTRLVDEMIPKETASEKAAADGWRDVYKRQL